MTLLGWLREQLPDRRGVAPVQLDRASYAEHASLLATSRGYGKLVRHRQQVAALRAAGYHVHEMGLDGSGAPLSVTWAPISEALALLDEQVAARRPGGKSVMAHPWFVAAQRAAADDPAATYARPEFRPG